MQIELTRNEVSTLIVGLYKSQIAFTKSRNRYEFGSEQYNHHEKEIKVTIQLISKLSDYYYSTFIN